MKWVLSQLRQSDLHILYPAVVGRFNSNKFACMYICIYMYVPVRYMVSTDRNRRSVMIHQVLYRNDSI